MFAWILFATALAAVLYFLQLPNFRLEDEEEQGDLLPLPKAQVPEYNRKKFVCSSEIYSDRPLLNSHPSSPKSNESTPKRSFRVHSTNNNVLTIAEPPPTVTDSHHPVQSNGGQ